jgi:hypothetical protein
MALVLDGAGPEAPDDGPGTREEEGEDVLGVGAPRRWIAAVAERDGDAGELVAAKGAVDGSAIAVGDLEDRAMKPGRDEAPMPSPLGPNGSQPGSWRRASVMRRAAGW